MKMTKLCLDLMRQHTKNRLERIGKHMERIDQLEAKSNSETIYGELASISRHTELLTQEIRTVVMELHTGLESLGLVPQYIPLPAAPGVEISVIDEIFSIKMDGMLPFFSKGGAYYLHGKLEAALAVYCMENDLMIPIFGERCAVVFLHHYNMEQSERRYIRDYDNLECRCVLNAITQYFLLDDEPMQMVLMHEIVPDCKNFTEVLVMKISDFKKFVEASFM